MYFHTHSWKVQQGEGVSLYVNATVMACTSWYKHACMITQMRVRDRAVMSRVAAPGAMKKVVRG